MQANVGTMDRVMRAAGAMGLFFCAFAAPFDLPVRVAIFALPGLYMLGSAVWSRCLGYRLMGRSTCPAH